MKLNLPISEFKTALTGLAKVAPRRSHLPILQGVCFDARNGAVEARATDLENSVLYRFQEAHTVGEGSFVVGLNDLKAVSKLGKDSGRIEFQRNMADQVMVAIEGEEQTITRPLPASDAEDFPPPLESPPTAPAPGFLDNYRLLAPFTADDASRGALVGICLDSPEEGSHAGCLVATDGKRLACRNTMDLPVKGRHVLPVAKFLLWNGLSGEASLGLRTGQKQTPLWALQVGAWEYQGRILDQPYPAWQKVLPSEPGQNQFTLGEQDVTFLLKTLPALGHCEFVVLAACNGSVTLWAKGQDDPDWTSLQLNDSVCTTALAVVTLDRKFLYDALKGGFMGSFCFEDDLSPVISRDGHGGTFILMPMRAAQLPPHLEKALNAAKAQTDIPEPPVAQTEPENATPEPPTPSKERKTTMPKPAEQAPMPEASGNNTLDRALTAFEEAKARLRELQLALSNVAGELKAAVRDQKSQAREIETARATLTKLRTITL